MSLLLYSLYVCISVTSDAVAAAWQYVHYSWRTAFLNGDKTKTVLHGRRREHLKSFTYPVVWFVLLIVIRVIKRLELLWARWVVILAEDLETHKNFWFCKSCERHVFMGREDRAVFNIWLIAFIFRLWAFLCLLFCWGDGRNFLNSSYWFDIFIYICFDPFVLIIRQNYLRDNSIIFPESSYWRGGRLRPRSCIKINFWCRSWID